MHPCLCVYHRARCCTLVCVHACLWSAAVSPPLADRPWESVCVVWARHPMPLGSDAVQGPFSGPPPHATPITAFDVTVRTLHSHSENHWAAVNLPFHCGFYLAGVHDSSAVRDCFLLSVFGSGATPSPLPWTPPL
jgi:hypothetical protein